MNIPIAYVNPMKCLCNPWKGKKRSNKKQKQKAKQKWQANSYFKCK